MIIKLKCSSIGILLLLLTACEGDEGEPGKNSLVNVVGENPGSDCVNGGMKIEYGLDQNRDNVLTSDEVQGQNLICNGRDGADGHNYLFDAIVESIGTNCQFGGYRLVSGLDSNRNGVLDVSEH